MARELALHFSGFGEQPSLVRMDDVDRYRKDAGYRQFLHFFSNNNACIRRSIWEKIPFPDTDFAEDQMWAKSVIEAGYAKAYAPDACVYHSHNFGVSESYQRAFDESSALKRLFGYDLVPSIAYLLVQWGRLVWRDWKWIGEDNSSIETKSRWFFKMPFLTLARLAGFYMGGNQDRLPNWLIDHFSRDKTLQRS
jgi:rhamnosyltransferase